MPAILAVVASLASSENSAAYAASKAFDGSPTSAGSFWATAAVPSGWLRAQLATATVVTSYRILPRADVLGDNPRDWTFEGSNDGTTFTPLDTRSGITWSADVWQAFTFTNTTAYLYYRLNITAISGGDGYLSVAELTFRDDTYAPSPYTAAVLADSPWGFWELAETTGLVLADSSGNNRSMSISETAPTLNQTGPFSSERSIAWPSAIGKASTTASVPTSSVTAEVWVYLTANPAIATQVLSMAATGDTHDKDMWIGTDGKVNFYFYPGFAVTIVSTTALTLNTWHHVVASVGAAGAKLRIDKTTAATDTNTSSYIGSQAAHLHIGSLSGTGGTTGNAAMSVAAPAIYTAQLTDARTDAHYDAGMAVIVAAKVRASTMTSHVAVQQASRW